MPRPGPLEAADPRNIGPYRLTGRIGRGGQGIVYLATDESGAEVAIKYFTGRTAADESMRRRFRGEIEAVRRVAPFCTARVLDAGIENDHPYIVSEYVDGVCLQDYVRNEGPRSGGALDRIAVGTATALAAIHHAGVIHRDFKPQNVLLGVDGLRVIDFGIARLLEQAAATTSQIIVGTPAYMAPEQIAGETITPAADMFGWGATIAYAATGRAAFGAESYPAVLGRILYGKPDLDGLTGVLRDLVTACLGKDPAARPTADDVLRTLRSGASHGHATAWPIASSADADHADAREPAAVSAGEGADHDGSAAVAGDGAAPSGGHASAPASPSRPDAITSRPENATSLEQDEPGESPAPRPGAGALRAGADARLLQAEGGETPDLRSAQAAPTHKNGWHSAPSDPVPGPREHAGVSAPGQRIGSGEARPGHGDPDRDADAHTGETFPGRRSGLDSLKTAPGRRSGPGVPDAPARRRSGLDLSEIAFGQGPGAESAEIAAARRSGSAPDAALGHASGLIAPEAVPGRPSGPGAPEPIPGADSPETATGRRSANRPVSRPSDPPTGDAVRRRVYAAVAAGAAVLASLAAAIYAMWPAASTAPGTTAPGATVTSSPAVPQQPGRETPPAGTKTQPGRPPVVVTGTTAPSQPAPTPPPSAEPGTPPSATPETSPTAAPETPPPTPEATPTPSPSPPEEKPTFAGEWAGTVRRPGRRFAFPVKISLTEAAVQGTDTGAMTWAKQCAARLTRASATDEQITFTLDQVRGRGCRGGTLVMSGLAGDQATAALVSTNGVTRATGPVRR